VRSFGRDQTDEQPRRTGGQVFEVAGTQLPNTRLHYYTMEVVNRNFGWGNCLTRDSDVIRLGHSYSTSLPIPLSGSRAGTPINQSFVIISILGAPPMRSPISLLKAINPYQVRAYFLERCKTDQHRLHHPDVLFSVVRSYHPTRPNTLFTASLSAYWVSRNQPHAQRCPTREF